MYTFCCCKIWLEIKVIEPCNLEKEEGTWIAGGNYILQAV